MKDPFGSSRSRALDWLTNAGTLQLDRVETRPHMPWSQISHLSSFLSAHPQSVQIGRLSMVKLEAEAGADEWHIADFRQKGSRTKRGTQVVF